MSSEDVGNGLLEFIRNTKPGQEEIILPTISEFQESGFSAFSEAEDYYIQLFTPFIVMVVAIVLWLFLLTCMACKACLWCFPCCKQPKCNFSLISILIFGSFLSFGFSFTGYQLLDQGLDMYTENVFIATEKVSGVKSGLVQLLVNKLSQSEVESCENITANVFNSDFDPALAAFQDIDMAVLSTSEELETVEAAGIETIDALLESTKLIEIFYVLLTVLITATTAIIFVAAIRTQLHPDDESSLDACFCVGYSIGIIVIIMIWITAAFLSFPTFVGADICVGNPTDNLQNSLRRTIQDETRDFCDVLSGDFSPAEERLGNIACYYGECRGALFAFEQINGTKEDIVTVATFVNDFEDMVNSADCTQQLEPVFETLDELESIVDANGLECEQLQGLFFQVINEDLCEDVVTGIAIIYFTWVCGTIFLMTALILNCLNTEHDCWTLMFGRKGYKKRQAMETALANNDHTTTDNEYKLDADGLPVVPEFTYGDELDQQTHRVSLITTLFLHTSLGVYIGMSVLIDDETASTPLYVFLGAIGLYFLEAIVFQFFSASGVMSDLRKPADADAAIEFFEKARAVYPAFSMFIECYHFETRTNTYTDSDGNTRTTTTQVRVVTHTATEAVKFRSWEDVSPISSIEDGEKAEEILRRRNKMLKYTLKYHWSADANSMANFNAQKQNFYNRHAVDVYQNCFFIYNTACSGKPTLTVKSEKSVQSSCFTVWMYLLLTVIGLSWIHRMYIEWYTDRRLWVNNKKLTA